MKAKLCYKDEIHRVSNLPDTLKALTQLVSALFHSPLPQSWVLKYTDSDDDDILIDDEKDYEKFRNSEPKNTSAITKLFVVSAEAFRPPEVVLLEENPIKLENDKKEEYQIIEKVEIKPKNIIEIEDDTPLRKKIQKRQALLEETDLDDSREAEVVEEPQSPETPKIIEVSEELAEPKREEPIESMTRLPVEEHKKEEQDTYETRNPVSEKEKEEKIKMEGAKIHIDMNDLAKLVSGMIDKSLPKIVQITQQQLEEQRNSFDQSMINASNSNLLAEEQEQSVSKISVPKAVHHDVRCNLCQASPIVGVRYKCTVCPNYNCCEFCEECAEHPHNMIKLKKPEAPVYKAPKINQPVEVLKPVTAAEWMKFNPNCESLVDELRRVRNDEKVKEMKEVQKDLEGVEKTHYEIVIQKAEKLKKCFPKEDFDSLCIYVNEAPEDMSIEELVENFKLGHNE